MQSCGGMPRHTRNHPDRVTTPAPLASLGAAQLATTQGGKLPPGYDEALAAGEKAAQRRSRKKLLY